MTTIWQLLEGLPAHFALIARSATVGEQASQAAAQLLELANKRQTFDEEQSQRLER